MVSIKPFLIKKNSIRIILILFVIGSTPIHLIASEQKTIYLGSEACRECHPDEYKRFTAYAKKSKSFQSITKLEHALTQEEIQRCYSCHTTGYGQPSGFVSPQETPYLKNAGCEVCHGPGSLHVKTQNKNDIKGKLSTEDCNQCHISERVKAFRYKPLIRGGAH